VVLVAGADGCRAGWVVALVDGRSVAWEVLATAAEVCALDVAALAVDIPIGLPSGSRRACDVLARRRLPGAGSRVFPTPPRAVLGSTTYAEACERAEADSGRRLSRQTWGIWPKIADFDAAPRDDRRVVECHPEVSFAAMAGRVLGSKHSPAGLAERASVLRGWVDVDEALGSRPRGAAPDDCLDALACAWTARRWALGEAEVLGGELDAAGTPMRIVV
jgi:predicted RNase H-like nuclease